MTSVPDARVEIAAQRVHERLRHVLDHRETAGHVAVERRVARRHLALVAAAEHHPAELVGDGHHRVAADARLQVLLGDVGRPALEHRREHRLERGLRRLDRHDVRANAEPIGERDRVGDTALARVARRQHHAVHVLGAERVDRDRGDERRVDPAREADQHVGEAVLAHVVTRAEHERFVDLVHRLERRLDATR